MLIPYNDQGAVNMKRVMNAIVGSIICSLALQSCQSTTSLNATSSNQDAKTTTQVQHKTLRGSDSSKGNSTHNLKSAAITLEKIMADPDWIGRQPEQPFWGVDSQSVLYRQKQKGNNLRDLWLQPTSAGSEPNASALRKVTGEELHLFSHKNKIWDRTKNRAIWSIDGSIFLYDKESQGIRLVSQDTYSVYNLQFLTDGRIAYRLGHDIYAINPKTGTKQILVSWRFAEAPKPNSPIKGYIAKQQFALVGALQNQHKNRQLAFKQEQQLTADNSLLGPEPFYFSKHNNLVEASLAPNGKWLIVVEEKNIEWRDDSDIMPKYINLDGRIHNDKVRRRVADEPSRNHKVWLIDLTKRVKTKLSFNQLPDFNKDVLADVKLENALNRKDTYTPNRLPRNIVLMDDWYWQQSAIVWHSNGNNVAIMLEAWDNKDRWINTVDLNKGQLIPQHHLHDPAWINYKFNSFGWLNNSNALYYLSEESGYAHLYLKPINGKATTITSGQFEVDNLTLSSDDKVIYFKANIEHPGIYEVYKVALESKKITRLTQLNGMTDYILSPDQTRLLLTHSKLATPPELYIQAVDQSSAQRITHTVSDEFLAINWQAPDIVPIPSSHVAKPIFSKVYAPSKINQNQLSKAVVFNHGAGYLQNAHLGWSGYFREFMFHNLLVHKGYVVLDMDYRASAGYGRDWRTAIYRQMGTPEVQDLQDGVNWLVEQLNVDRKRVGTYGGSYGGFITFMAMFTQPELFNAGAALRPVTDWANYNHSYTSNILNTPQIDPIAYQRSSPIYFAQGLTNPLLISAPMVDSNVFFVDVVRLVQRLIELEKQDFETAIYPVESHGFIQSSSWLDQYRRILKLFDTNL